MMLKVWRRIQQRASIMLSISLGLLVQLKVRCVVKWPWPVKGAGLSETAWSNVAYEGSYLGWV